MIKLLGLLAVTVSCAMGGFYISSMKRKRVSQLEEIIRLIKEIEISMGFSRLVLYELFERLRKNGAFSKLEFIDKIEDRGRPFFEEYREAILKSDLALKQDELELLLSFGKELGTTDANGQAGAAVLYGKMFEGRFITANADCERKCRLFSSLGVLTGVFISIILM